jgi:ribonuclease BN (tRNA processing enzyme)
MSFRVTLLGSGTIIPSIERRSTALLVEAGERTILFDCGPGTLEALAEEAFSFRDLKEIFLTHYHPDHSLGIGQLLAAINADPVSRYAGRLRICGPPGLAEFIDRWRALYRSTAPKWDFLELRELAPGAGPGGADAAVTAAAASHADTAALSYRIDHKGKSVVYTGDTSYSDTLVELARDADLLVAECSYPDSHPVEGHMTPAEVGRLAAGAAARHVVLVHLYPVFDDDPPAAAVKQHYRGSVEIGYDGLEFALE